MEDEVTQYSTKKIIVGGSSAPADWTDQAGALAWQNEQIEKSEVSRLRGLKYEKRQRLPYLINKGLTKPGAVSFSILRRAANAVHVARICINVLKEKISKTKWGVQPIDPQAHINELEQQIDIVEHLLKYPNRNGETWRTLLDKVLEDLLSLDWTGIEKTRYVDTDELAELFYVDAETIRPVYDEWGNMDVLLAIHNAKDEDVVLPVSYVQVIDSNQYGGRESGEVVAYWPKKDFINFSVHPQGAMNSYGFGLSPLEAVIGVVANILNADNFNGTYFEDGAFPPAIIHLQSNMGERELEAARSYMYSEINGRYHRPMIVAGEGKVEVSNLKDLTQRDMQFMDYMNFMATLLAAAYGLSKQDIGLTEGLDRAIAETEKDLSQAKGYGSILALLKDEINKQIIWDDFGFDQLEFDWVAPDTMNPAGLSDIIDKRLKNGTMTINEARKALGEEPYGEWGDEPTILGNEGFKKLGIDQSPPGAQEGEDGDKEGGNEFGQDNEKLEGKSYVNKSIASKDGQFMMYVDDRGVSQPFIFYDVLTLQGRVVKPIVAVALDSQRQEVAWTQKLFHEGYPVVPVRMVSEVDVYNKILPTNDIKTQFKRYQQMEPEYDSMKWTAKFGHSRKFPTYLVSKYVSGRNLKDAFLLEDMRRVPASYYPAIDMLARLWLMEQKYVMGDRRADQYLITPDKQVWAFDYQFFGNEARWKGTANSIPTALATIPELQKRFLEKIGQTETKKGITKTIFRKK